MKRNKITELVNLLPGDPEIQEIAQLPGDRVRITVEVPAGRLVGSYEGDIWLTLGRTSFFLSMQEAEDADTGRDLIIVELDLTDGADSADDGAWKFDGLGPEPYPTEDDIYHMRPNRWDFGEGLPS